MDADESTDKVMHEVYLPVTETQLRAHFAPITADKGDPDKHLTYYRKSLAHLRAFEVGVPPAPKDWAAATKHARRLEKDERFWVAAALLSAFYPDAGRVERLAQLLQRALGDVPPMEGMPAWHDCLSGPLHLFFEVNLPSPKSYKEWLHAHLDERILVPYVRKAATRAGLALEGATKVDALLLAEDTGFSAVFEGKVLSDASSMVSFDVMRNQLARTIDVTMFDKHSGLAGPLPKRQPDRTCVVLLTPRVFEQHPRSRLYGHLFSEYRHNWKALSEDLPHRTPGTNWSAVSRRLGWLTFEDCADIIPGSCRWLTEESASRLHE